jgi:hypothetical protein
MRKIPFTAYQIIKKPSLSLPPTAMKSLKFATTAKSCTEVRVRPRKSGFGLGIGGGAACRAPEITLLRGEGPSLRSTA